MRVGTTTLHRGVLRGGWATSLLPDTGTPAANSVHVPATCHVTSTAQQPAPTAEDVSGAKPWFLGMYNGNELSGTVQLPMLTPMKTFFLNSF